MSFDIETIPDEDKIHRLIDFPNMYDGKKNLIWPFIFQFPDSLPESVIWNKYTSTINDVHQHGAAWETFKQAKKPSMRYVGFISSVAGDVRAIRTKPGHGFSVSHSPSEGIHHAQIAYDANGHMTKGHRSELKLALQNVFSPMVHRS